MKKTKTTYYCDICGIEITDKNKPIPFHTPWNIVKEMCNVTLLREVTYIKGEGCNDCFKSYKEWVKSRDGSRNKCVKRGIKKT